jgi:dTDP-4-amino-4,6-dideoxygalactose transaminase
LRVHCLAASKLYHGVVANLTKRVSWPRYEVREWLRRCVRKYAPPRVKTVIRQLLQRLPAPDAGEDQYPRILGDEVAAVARVLKSGAWNMQQGQRLAHHALEEEFATYVNAKHAVAVNTGGMAIQIALRALGIRPGDEVIHQVDTCVANAFAIMAAGGTPIFADIDPATMMLAKSSLDAAISERTKVLMPIHMWGNSEDLDTARSVAQKHGLRVVEDCCLSLGARYKGRRVGVFGDVGIFSFGMLKPIQAGEGGMIVTSDDALAREIRTIRSYGDRTQEYGERDQVIPSWNGRMSEILAAVLLEQLRNYDALLGELQSNVQHFAARIAQLDGVTLVHNGRPIGEGAYTQVVLKLVDPLLQQRKPAIMTMLYNAGVGAWHANFEPINSLAFFRTGLWRDWILRGDMERIERNYAGPFPNAEHAFHASGLGLLRDNFLSRPKTDRALRALGSALRR